MNANNQHSSSSNTDYNYEDARLRASVLWLIVRIYGGDDNQLPDSLRKPFKQDSQGRLALTTPVEACLTNGSFYCQAASRIFKDNSILTNNIGSVFHALAQAGIDVRDGEGASVTEPMLTAQSPFNTQAHMHLIDALMTAHLRAVVSIEKVVQAISSYTAIEKREEPLDCVDSLLFWINKVCLLVRDDVERNGMRLAGADSDEATIPEMEDLYEELCDGTCICTLASFYRPNELSLQEIRFKDQMSVADCHFNLELLKRFCSAHLPWDPFHFAIDDLLYLHESLQPNVNAFLADLFHFFELTAAEQCQPVEPEPAPSQPAQHRRFVPIQPIPDLRGVPAKLAGGDVASKLANARLGLDKRDRAMSAASEESMMTGTTLKSRDSLCFASPRQPRLDPSLPVTHFGAVQPATPSTLSAQNQLGIGHSQQTMGLGMEQQQQQQRGGTGLAQIRLHMEQMKRSLSRRQQLESAQQEQQRNEASKDAFFRVMSRSAHNGLSPQTTPLNSNRLAEQSGEGTSLQQQLQQLPGQFNSQLNMAMLAGSGTSNANVNNSGSHYDQPQQTPMQQQALMTRSTMQLNQQQQQMNQPMAFQGAGLQYPLQTSTPQSRQQQQLLAQQQQQNQLQHNHSQHYAIPQQHQQQNLSPIGPPPPGSFHYMSSGSNEASFQHTPNGQGQAVQLHQQQMMVPHSLPHFPGGGQYFPQQQQNFTPIPNGPAPVYQHQLAMAGHQQLQPQPFNVYSGGIPNGNYGGPSVDGQQLYFSPNPAGTGYQLARQPAGQVGPLQPSFSQPSHLHMLHQQQQAQGGGQFQQQQPMLFQTPSGYQQHQQAVQQGGYGGGGVPMAMAQQQQHPFGGSSATMFASTETLVLPQQQLNSSNSQQMVQQQQQPATIVEEPSPFRLHQTNAPASRLDPQLELNKDLTNWGMTYRAGDRPQRKTWAEKRAEHEQQQQLANSSPPNAQNNQNNNNSSSSSDPLGAVAMPVGPFISGIATANSTPEREQQQLVMMTSSQMSGGNNDGSMSARAGTGVLLEDASEPNTEMTPEMQARRRALLASQLRRKERIVAKSEEKDATTESLERRHTELAKLEQAEQRKAEREVRRQKLLEDYKRKKMEQELGESPTSARSAAAGGGATTSSTTALNRGHSQPPFGRPKSQSNLNLIHSGRSTLQRPGRTQSNMMGSQNGGEEENMTPRVPSSIAGEPQLKLFAKAQPKSNRSLIMNALQYSIFPGHVSNENRQKAQAAIATSDSKHFLVLFRDHRLQYRAIYTWDQFSDTVHKIEGMGPKVCREPMMSLMFKYDSGAKSFGPIPTKHLSATIDGFVIADQYWQKPKIPHSGR